MRRQRILGAVSGILAFVIVNVIWAYSGLPPSVTTPLRAILTIFSVAYILASLFLPDKYLRRRR
jgi:hypothetical protein